METNGKIHRVIEDAVNKKALKDQSDVVAIKILELHLKNEHNINIDFTSLRRRVEHYFKSKGI